MRDVDAGAVLSGVEEKGQERWDRAAPRRETLGLTRQ